MAGIDSKTNADRFAAEYIGWDRARLAAEQRRLEAKQREPHSPKKLQNIMDRLAAIRAALGAAGHVQVGPTPSHLIPSGAASLPPSRLAEPPRAAPPKAPAPPAQGRGPMGPVGVELDQMLAE